MSKLHRDDFLHLVSSYIKQDPEAAAHVADYVQAGLREALQESRERAADMEVIVATLVERKYKGADELVLSKLKKWQGKTSCEWGWLVDRLEGK